MSKDIDIKIEEGRSYRDMEVRIRQDSDNIVEGYATTFNDPYLLWRDGDYEVWEQIDRNAFVGADMRDVIMQYNHEGRVFARKSNNTLTVQPDEKGLFIAADLSGTEIGRQLYEEIRGGYTNKMSFGFTVGEDKREIEENQVTGATKVMRTITKIAKLYDVSAVSLPANPATSISSRTDGEGVIAEVKEEVRIAEEMRIAKERQKQKIRILLEVKNGN